MIHIYYVEDDAVIARSVKEYLEPLECRVEVFQRMEEARKALRKNTPSMVLIDWNMPDGQGKELCQWIRMRWEEIPIIFITVRGEACDMVSGFQMGADDYVVKPFDLEVLYSRIKALLRRMGKKKKTYLFCDNIYLDKEKKAVFNCQEEIPVSQQEYQVLLILLENKGKTVMRSQLIDQIWDQGGNYVNDNTLTVTMKRLREKLGKPSCIKTIRSFGYRMEESV